MAVVINGNGTVTGITAQDELNVDSDTLVVDSTNNRVGIGTSSPDEALHLHSSGITRLKVTGSSGEGEDNGIKIYQNAVNTTIANGDNGYMRFYTNNTERMQIQADGSLLLGTNDGGASGSGDMVVNGGIYIGGNQAANYLDDYEEGTWTPTFLRSSSNPTSTTYTDTWGTYTKIGRVVHVSGRVQLTTIAGSAGSGNVRIGNLPFTVGGTSDGFTTSLGVVFGGGWSSTNAPRVGFAKINQTYIGLYSGDSADARDTQDTPVSNLSNNCGVIFNLTYNI